ncbi:carbonic anhydrase family protein [Myxococcota bacterium]|nr:carbonic anhydrase family protein [Myxococcota bacterium]
MPSSRPVEWGYRGGASPERWASLDPAYSACGHAGTQSPIDLAGETVSDGSTPIRMDYRPTGLRIAHHQHVTDILDDGHTIQVTVEEGSRLTTPRDTYALRQFHFHAPSEHVIDGRAHPLEIHFVHRSASGRFAVVAAFVDPGEPNTNFARLIEHFPAERGAVVHRPEVTIDPGAHFAKTLSAFSYAGSFTTPPCTEDVEWIVLGDPLTASRDQIEAFAAKLEGNARPIQLRGDREIGLRSLSRMPDR